MFGPLLEVLPAWLATEVVRYPPAQLMSYEDLGRHIEPFLLHQEPFILLAESFSGPAAIRLAATRPKGLAASTHG